MSKQLRWMVILFLLLGLTGLACDALSGGDDSDSTVETAGDAVSSGESADSTVSQSEGATSDTESVGQEETEASDVPAEDNEVLDLSTISSELDLDSYQLALLMSFSGVDDAGVEFAQDVTANISYMADPLSMEMTMSLEGLEDAGEFNEISMVQIEDTSYMILPGMGCISSSVADGSLFDDNPFAEFLDPDEFLSELDGARRVGTEVVNGVQTNVYEFDETFMDASSEMERAEGRLYVAQDGNYVVRLEMDGHGAMDLLGEGDTQTGSIHLEFDITNINRPIEIGMPEGCEEGAGGGPELPLLEDAFEVTSFGDILSFKSESSVEDAVAFYESVLTADGWTKNEDESFDIGGSMMLTFERDADSINLTIGTDDESGGISVLIITEAGE